MKYTTYLSLAAGATTGLLVAGAASLVSTLDTYTLGAASIVAGTLATAAVE